MLVASGGAPPTVRRIAEAGIKTFTEGATGYSRASDRHAPYNLMMALRALGRTLKAPRAAGELPALGRGGATCPRASRPARSPHGSRAGTPPPGSYQGGGYVNSNSYAAEGDQFKPDNLLVLRVQVGDAGYKDPAGNPVPETKFTGTGQALLFHGGRVVRGTWKKADYDATIELSAKGGG